MIRFVKTMLCLVPAVIGFSGGAAESSAARMPFPRETPLSVGTSAPNSDDDEVIDFGRDVQPILSNHCYTCHGPDARTREAGLRLDDPTLASGEADSGAIAIVPGEPDESELMFRIQTDDLDYQMPPQDGGTPLSPEQIEILRRWIEDGAEYQAHWAFISPTRPEIPVVGNASWPRNEIDRFVLARLESRNLEPAAEATRETLIRRVAFDVTGLPPTIEEIDLFLNDSAPGAYERMLDRYLESPAYGEEMARRWLDLARYADSNGYQYDTEREQWVWRDWVIHAYNRNQPFDQFSIDQLAGDLLPNSTDQQRLATGFNRNHGITIEGGIIDEEYRVEYVMDRLVTTAGVWMGLTIGCARCHDHKFDPISQQEFFELYAYFNQVPEKGMNGFEPREKIASPFATARLEQIDHEIAQLRQKNRDQPDTEDEMEVWARRVAEGAAGWRILDPLLVESSGGSSMTVLRDDSILIGEPNPAKDIYKIVGHVEETGLRALRLEALTHPSLPGGGPGRHTNSNFVLSEIELLVTSVDDPSKKVTVKFASAKADYSQSNYEIAKAIDGTVQGNNGWAVDGPTRKEPATAIFVAEEPFGFEGGSILTVRLRHEANFATHGIGRPRISFSNDEASNLEFHGDPPNIVQLARKDRESRTAEEQLTLFTYYFENHSRYRRIEERIHLLEQSKADSYPATMVMRDLPKPRPTFVLERGQYDKPTAEAPFGVPEVLPQLAGDALPNRLGFAQWLFEPSHPLTARVAVNRYWQQMFGIGLVGTPEDFGIQGESPSHPALLDWLAVEFVECGWDVKHMLRLIMNSATYRQSSAVGQEAYQRDPANRLLARGPRMRLSAEQVRDHALAVSGLLVTKLGGRSVYPYQPPGLWLELNNRPGYSKEYQRGTGDDLYRRSLYTFWKRTVPSPMLKTLDAPEREFCTIQRSRTNTPLQSLLLMNGVQFVEAARHLGARLISEGGDLPAERIEYGFRLVVSRSPADDEAEVVRDFLAEQISRFNNDPEAARQLLQVGDSRSVDHDIIEHAAWTMVARLLLNLDEAITKG